MKKNKISFRASVLFKNKYGKIRLIWMLIAAAACAVISLVAVPMLLNAGFTKLFESMNLSASTYSYAAGPARFLYDIAGTLISCAGYALMILSGKLLAGKISKGFCNIRELLFPLLPVICELFLICTDSIRLKTAVPAINSSLPAGILLCLLYSLAEAVWIKGTIPALISRINCPQPVAKALCCACFAVVVCLRSGLRPLLIMNMCLLYVLLVNTGVSGFFAVQAAWLLINDLILSYENSGSVFELLDVSEAVMTGGSYGIQSGLMLTLALTTVILFKYRRRIVEIVKAHKKPEVPEYISGKRNKRNTSRKEANI